MKAATYFSSVDVGGTSAKIIRNSYGSIML